MNLLSIETSGAVCGVAISMNDTLVTAIEILRPNQHDERLVSCTEQCLENAGLRITDIDAVAVSSGPGSFTGLRIGASFAKGLCEGGTPRLIAVPTPVSLAFAALEVARGTGADGIDVVIASHGDLAYLQRFSISAEPITECELLNVSTISTLISGSKTLIVGPGAGLVTSAHISGLSRCSPRFVSYAVAALRARGVDLTVDAMEFIPNYRQDFVPKTAPHK
jgi:tRNA threonylcarbamoyladenosine biosynthesis protein TsaB